MRFAINVLQFKIKSVHSYFDGTYSASYKTNQAVQM
jgi:hypothetical protein